MRLGAVIISIMQRMAKVISISNRKGGVGKTTSCVNLGAALGLAGHKTLLIDFDSQASMTKGLLQNPAEAYCGDWLLDRAKFDAVAQQTEFKNLFLVPSETDLVADEMD